MIYIAGVYEIYKDIGPLVYTRGIAITLFMKPMITNGQMARWPKKKVGFAIATCYQNEETS